MAEAPYPHVRTRMGRPGPAILRGGGAGHGRLSPDYPGSDRERFALLSAEIRELIGATERFYARLVRIDQGWRQRVPEGPSAIARLRERLGQSVAR